MDRFLRAADVAVGGKRVFLRLDLNVPVKEGRISDDTRIRAAIPTIQDLLGRGAAVVACSHLGRPKGQAVSSFSLAPVAQRLRELLPEKSISLARDVVGPDAQAKAAALLPGELLLLENVRFEAGETKGDEGLAGALYRLAPDLFVNDAFGAAHRPHASVFALPRRYASVSMGALLEREITYLSLKLGEPERPYLAILGGVKVSDKIPVLTHLVQKVDALCIGGAMAYTFLSVQGHRVGASLVEPEQVENARQILETAERRGVEVHLPLDHIVSTAIDAESSAQQIASVDIPEGLAGFDIGPISAADYGATAARSKTILWNGPMGVFERKAFSAGTMQVAPEVVRAFERHTGSFCPHCTLLLCLPPR